ncbi:MAG: peptidylprolyl isomerase [Salinivirgaceae bacterium]|nr:peptidylprolyl isomerase [Salinivirgaceae bacterium]
MRKFLLALAMISAMPAIAQKNGDDVILTIDNEQISKDEFVRLYQKNNTDITFDSASLAGYMSLFIDYKLKVLEAESLGMDTTDDFKREFDGYRIQLEKPYFTDPSVDDSLAREAYEHMHWDIRASHILINCSENASAADTLKAYKRIKAIRDRAVKGEDFAKLARENSEDPSAKRNDGDLGYFTAFSMIYEFEKEAYATEVGAVSPIFRTRFGYHIIKVFDRRANPGQVRASHLMVRVAAEADEAAQKASAAKIKMIADSLAAGSDWAKMVSRYSDDRGTVPQNGDLQWFSTGRMVPEFESAAFALKNVGDISAPVRTSYGWHIIKLTDKKPIDSFENLQEQIKNRLSRDARSQMAEKAVLERLKHEYKFTEDKAAYAEFVSKVDTSVWSGKWTADKAKGLNKVIFSFADVKFTQNDYAKLVESNGTAPRMPVEVLLQKEYDRIVEETVLSYERQQLSNKYPEFRYLLLEYHDGILLFALMDKMVWTKAATDTVGLESFYEANKQKYMWGERVEVAYCTYDGNTFTNPDKNDKFSTANKKNFDSKMVAALKAGAKNGDYEAQVLAAMQKFGISPDSISMGGNSNIFNIVDGQWCDIDGIRIDKNAWGKSKSKVMNHKGRSFVFYLVRNLPAEPKTFKECRGAVIADYQNKLEADWLEQLRQKHSVKINESVFNSIIRK